jgi:hypothetical protein
LGNGLGTVSAQNQCISDVWTGNPFDVCACYINGENVSGNWWECCSVNTTGNDCSANPSLNTTCTGTFGTQGSCSSLTQECDPDGGVCLITGAGSAYEPCDSISVRECATWPTPLTCSNFGTKEGTSENIGQCCNETDAGCHQDHDCCQGNSCTVQNSGPPAAAGECKLNNGWACTHDSQCLWGGCGAGGCN